MKKNYLLVAGLASMMAFSACSNDDDLGINPNPVVSEVVEGATFEISLSSPANGNTKAVRPMGSSAADNSVDVIHLVAYYYDTNNSEWKECTLFNQDQSDPATAEKIGFKYISGECTGMTAGQYLENGNLYYSADVAESVPGTDTHITKKAKIQAVGLVKDTKYQFVAYGYNSDNEGYPYGADNSKAPDKVTTTGFENGVFKAAVSNATTAPSGYELEEIFADTDISETVEITTDDGTAVVFNPSPSLTLTRQVAGILAYFKSIPSRMNRKSAPSEGLYNVEELRIVASHQSKDFYFPAILLEDENFNGIADENNSTEDLIVFDFSEIATNYEAKTASDKLNAQTNYTFNGVDGGDDKKYPFAEGYADNAPADLTLATGDNNEGTIFGARYVLPYDKHYTDAPTLKLQFWGAQKESDGGDETLVLLEERDITTPNTDLFDAYTYDICCNNFYSIGQKLATDSTEGPDEDDDDDNDKPIDLRSDNINVRINDAWDVLHNMGVDNIE